MRFTYLSTPFLCLFLLIPQPAPAINFTYTGDFIPEWLTPYGKDEWTKSTDNAIPASIEDDNARTVLHLNDNSTSGGSHLFLFREWDIVPTDWNNTTTFVVRAVSNSSQLGSYFGMQSTHTDGSKYHVFYVLYPSFIRDFTGQAPDYLFDTTAAYSTYSIVLHQGISSLSINGQFAFSHPAKPTLHAFPRNGVEFGAGSSGATGEAYWDHVSATQAPTPEPSTILMLSLGLMGIVARRLRIKRQ